MAFNEAEKQRERPQVEQNHKEDHEESIHGHLELATNSNEEETTNQQDYKDIYEYEFQAKEGICGHEINGDE
jgi:hypothetical protein